MADFKSDTVPGLDLASGSQGFPQGRASAADFWQEVGIKVEPKVQPEDEVMQSSLARTYPLSLRTSSRAAGIGTDGFHLRYDLEVRGPFLFIPAYGRAIHHVTQAGYWE
ncbi:Hypp6323 [Branchiostoma lanceolatum]|uniref:Hypp6323 protein n=1 Tax=Branchiostoma lanceolatum TaxID=7740 RepID=A0A8J9YT21_BRALA|nr:Hypp6323 [Branchiostoma lanceolatum]